MENRAAHQIQQTIGPIGNPKGTFEGFKANARKLSGVCCAKEPRTAITMWFVDCCVNGY